MSQQYQSGRLQPSCNTSESSTAPHCEPILLNLGRKVFLSHSGKDKDFTRRLCKELCNSYHGIEVAFFDEKSLPKAEAITMEKTIVEEARRSALGVLVLTEGFFTQTRNPMLELEAFVAGKVHLLPLFFTMSVEEFKEKERWDRWERKWEEWAAADEKLVIEKWRSYLKIVRTYGGLEYCKIAPDGRLDLYIDEVVKQVARFVGPAVPMSGEDVYGKARLCRVVDDMFKKCMLKRSSLIDHTATQSASTYAGLDSCAYGLVGIHGFLGLGKTTLSKCLCDYYFGELNGKVCYINLGLLPQSRLSRMQHVLSRLDGGNIKDIDNLHLDSDQVKNLLKKRLSSMKNPVFLAIDNILPNRKSQEEVFTYLSCEFPKGSKILITSRSESILTNLTSLLPHSRSFSAVIEYMPALEVEEARGIFEHDFPDLHYCQHSNAPSIEETLQRDVIACVHKGTVFSGKQYHPLMLKSLAAFVRWDRLTRTADWRGRLAKLASEEIVHKDGALEQVFQVFENSYGLLAEKAKKVFLDLALCYSATIDTGVMQGATDYYRWIKMLHAAHLNDREIGETLLQLQDLCFIGQREYSGTEECMIEIQDLFVDFAKHKVAGADSDGYLVLEGSAHWPDALPWFVRYVSISRCREVSGTVDLRHVEGVMVLHLVDNECLKRVLLSQNTSTHLHSIIVSVPKYTALRCIVSKCWSNQSLKWFDCKGDFDFHFTRSELSSKLSDLPKNLGSKFLGGFLKLEFLKLNSLLPSTVESIDLTSCAKLKWLEVQNLPGLKSIRVLGSSQCLEQVNIKRLLHLEELVLAVPANSNPRFSIEFCASLQRVSLCMMPSISFGAGHAAGSHGFLAINCCPLVANVDGLLQFKGRFRFHVDAPEDEGQQYRFWKGTFADIVKEDAGIESFRCKATVKLLKTATNGPAGLGGVSVLHLENAQHVGLLISAIQPRHLQELMIRCRQGICGCDQNAPNFGTSSTQDNTASSGATLYPKLFPKFQYTCPQVKDLGGLAKWHWLARLSLQGCTSVEVWPDFGAMTSLYSLDLSNTSLREWPAGVDCLPGLVHLYLSGCQQLSAKEFILRAIMSDHRRECRTRREARDYVRYHVLTILRDELRARERDRCRVADALGTVSAELATYFEQLSWQDVSYHNAVHLLLVLQVLYETWFGGEAVDFEQKLYIMEKMRGLLSSESFLRLPCCAYRQFFLGEQKSHYNRSAILMLGGIGVLGITLAGEASLAYTQRTLPAVNDHYLRDRTIIFFKRRFRSQIGLFDSIYALKEFEFSVTPLTEEGAEMLTERAEAVLRTMAKEAGLEAEEDDTEIETGA